MKVLILSTFGNYGGAAVCSKRLSIALKRHNVDVTLGVLHAYDSESSFFLLQNNFYSKASKWVIFILERLQVFFKIREKKFLYKFSSGQFGVNILNNPIIKQADVIHLHWISFGFIDINQLVELSRIKPVLWTFHDMWAFTGGCHYTLGCNLYTKDCGSCFYLKNSKLSQNILKSKFENWGNASFRIAATSNWLAECARNSAVFNKMWVDVLSTPIDIDIFKPLPKSEIRKKYKLYDESFYLLIGAVDFSDERKGFYYLQETLDILSLNSKNIHVLTFGQLENELSSSVKCTSFGRISGIEELNEIYNLADIFVLPSIQDNLPNTCMEALSCGVPVVAFDCGGVNDMIDHLENGYLAANRQPNDLAKGINYFMDGQKRLLASINSRNKVVRDYSESKIVSDHIEVYGEMLKTFQAH